MIPTAVNALEKVVSGNGCFSIDLPYGVTWRRESSVRAIHVVESLYLQAFVDFLEERDPRVNTVLLSTLMKLLIDYLQFFVIENSE
jgi:hypothetical protein